MSEGLADGCRTFPFAERLVGHVRMDYVVMSFGRVGILGHDLVASTLSDHFPVQQDAERSQVCILQLDGGCQDADFLILKVYLYLHKILFQSSQVRGNIARTRNLHGRGCFGQLYAKAVEPASEVGC